MGKAAKKAKAAKTAKKAKAKRKTVAKPLVRSAQRQSVTVHYRRLEDPTGAFGELNLEAAIRKALNHIIDGGKVSEHWKRRAYVIPPSTEETLLMNLRHDGGGFYFGDLTLYTKGYLQALLAEAPDAPVLSIEQEPPPVGKEYVHSMMYWLVVKNHVFMIQSRSLTAKQLEEYLTWLLKDRTATIAPTGQVILQARFDAADVGGDLADIEEIIVGGTAAVSHFDVPRGPGVAAGGIEKYQKLTRRKPLFDRAFDVLLAVMNNEADVRKLLESVPEGADLEVSVHIGYKARKEVSRAPMQEALRNLPEGEITARGRDGRMTGNDIRLSHRVSVLKNGSLLDPDDVIRALREAHKHMVDNGKIE